MLDLDDLIDLLTKFRADNAGSGQMKVFVTTPANPHPSVVKPGCVAVADRSPLDDTQVVVISGGIGG